MCVHILDRNRAEVVTIGPTDTVKSAADRMRAHGIAALVVKSGAAITGLIFRSRDRACRVTAWRGPPLYGGS
jgi:hypothetical protein